MRSRLLLALALTCAVLAPTAAAATGIHKIKHIVIIMQENRSFDSYFGTYPGADGIPGLAGHPGCPACPIPPAGGACGPTTTEPM